MPGPGQRRVPMRSGGNLAAALASAVLTALIGLAVIPLYIRYLGVEGYGLVGFLATVQVMVQFLDFGMAATINREVARGETPDKPGEARMLLHTLAVVYWIVAGVIALVMAALSPLVAGHWFRADATPSRHVGAAIALMGVAIACRWPAQLYLGALMGARRIVLASALNLACVALGSGGAVLVLALVSPDIEAFLLWQAVVGLGYTLVVRLVARRIVGCEATRFDRRQLGRIWRFSAGLTVLSLSGIVLGQVDKVVLSKMLSLAEFGEYMLAVAVAGTLYLFSVPLFNVVYPRFSALVHSADTGHLTATYRLATRLLGAIVFPVAMLLCVFPGEIVQAWTGDPGLSRGAAAILPALAAGAALHGVMHLPYALQLAHGTTRLPLAINAILLAVILPLVVTLASVYGARGGAIAWLALHVVYLGIGTWLTHRRLLKGLGPRWIGIDVGVPAAISVLVGSLAFAMPSDGLGVYARLGCGIAWMVFAGALTVVLSPVLRATAMREVREWIHTLPQGNPT